MVGPKAVTISDQDLTRYTRIVAAMAQAEASEDVLSREGLTASEFEALESSIEGALSLALAEEGSNIAPFVLRYEAALRSAHAQALGKTSLSLEEYARGISIITSGHADPYAALKRAGLEMTEVMRASVAYAPELARNPAAAATFKRLSKPSPK